MQMTEHIKATSKEEIKRRILPPKRSMELASERQIDVSLENKDALIVQYIKQQDKLNNVMGAPVASDRDMG